MHKTLYQTLCGAVLLVTALAFMSGSKSVGSAPVVLTSPVIVARGNLVNQTAEIPQTTIYTPSATGLYRLSAYTVETVPVDIQNAYWSFNLFWTDDGGAQANYSNVYQPVLGGFGTATWTPGSVSVFRANAGQAVSYSVTLAGGTSGGTYSLYYTLEKIQ